MFNNIYAPIFPVSELMESEIVYDHFSLQTIIQDIRNGEFKDDVELIRSAPKDKRKELKFESLAVWCPCVNMPYYRMLDNNPTYQTTGIIQFDIDNIAIGVSKELKHLLIESIPELLYAFISPSAGLKFGILTDLNLNEEITVKEFRGIFSEAYECASESVQSILDRFCVKADTSVSSANLTCYMSYDPDAYLNLDCKIMLIGDKASERYYSKILSEFNNKKLYIQDNTEITEEQIVMYLDCVDRGLRFYERRKVNWSVMGLLGNMAVPLLQAHWNANGKLEKQLASQLKSYIPGSYGIGTLIYYAVLGGYKTSTRAC